MNKVQTFVTDQWKDYEKVLFRFFFLYFFIQVLPLDLSYFKFIFSVNWLHVQYTDIFNLTRYSPRFFSGPASYANWLVVAFIALVGTVIWTITDRKSKEY